MFDSSQTSYLLLDDTSPGLVTLDSKEGQSLDT